MLTYEWTVPDDHSPTSDDSNCLTKFYHSHVRPVKDINSGLIGPLIVCRRGNRVVIVSRDGPVNPLNQVWL